MTTNVIYFTSRISGMYHEVIIHNPTTPIMELVAQVNPMDHGGYWDMVTIHTVSGIFRKAHDAVSFFLVVS